MREILFRGKDNNVKGVEWVYGFYVVTDSPTRGKRHLIYTGEIEYDKLSAESYFPTICSRHFVDPETVCQYTGLTDNTKWEQISEIEQNKFLSEWNHDAGRRNTKEDWNGRKIFEGDIVKQFADCNGAGESIYFFYQIRWNKKYCAFEGYEIYTKETFLFPDLEDIEVVGNIYDNPELIG